MRLAAYLKKHGISKEEFAAKIGVHPTTIYRLVRGGNFPKLATCATITAATDGKVTANDFLRAKVNYDKEGEPA